MSSVSARINQELSDMMGDSTIDKTIINAVMQGRGKKSIGVITVEYDDNDYFDSKFQIANDLACAINAIEPILGVPIYTKAIVYNTAKKNDDIIGYAIRDRNTGSDLYDITNDRADVKITPMVEKIGYFTAQEILRAYIKNCKDSLTG
jgi:hypothetical protein